MMFAALFAVAAAAAPCHYLQSDKITGRDLAAASPIFANVDPSTFVAYTPAPGRSRLFRPEELKRFAETTEPLCFAWETEALTPARVRDAMLKAIGTESAQVEILEVSRDPVPVGDLQFSLTGLPATSSTANPAVWRGQVKYAGNRRCDVWARVRVTVPFERIVATAPIKTGEVVSTGQVRLEAGMGSPSTQKFATKTRRGDWETGPAIVC